MNVDLLESVRRTIARDPDRFCAAQWAFACNARQVLAEGAAPVGFRCCIAGHVLLESGTLTERDLLRKGGFHTGGGLWNRAAAALEVGQQRSRALFFPSQWVHPFKKQYYLCAQEEEAQIATTYLTHFIEKHGPSKARYASAPGGKVRGDGRPPRAPSADEESAEALRFRSGVTGARSE